MKRLGWRIVHDIPLLRSSCSVSPLAAMKGLGLSGLAPRLETKMKRPTPALAAASMRFRFPRRSTDSTVSSPPRAEELAVVTIMSTPAQAARSEAGSLRSPLTGSAPAAASAPYDDPSRTRMRTWNP
jgi:hypothetical protein